MTSTVAMVFVLFLGQASETENFRCDFSLAEPWKPRFVGIVGPQRASRRVELVAMMATRRFGR